MKSTKHLHTIDRGITWVVNAVMVVLFLAMLGIAAAQVILRYFFDTGIAWGDPVARTLVLWVGFLGAVLTTRDNKHFHLDVLTRLFPARLQLWLYRLSNLLAAAACLVLAQAGVSFLKFEGDARTFLNLPVAIVDVIIPMGFYLMVIQFVLRVFSDVEQVVPAEPVKEEQPG